MTEKTTMKAVASGVEELINAIAKAHRAWALTNQTQSGLLERSVSYCAFEILRNTFRLEGFVTEEGQEQLDQFVESVVLPLAPLEDTIKTKASA